MSNALREGDVVVTKAGGQIVAVTRQDEEGRILSVLAESEPQRKPLTDEQIDRLDTQAIRGGPDSQYAFRFARAIERELYADPLQRKPLTDNNILWLLDQVRARQFGAPRSSEEIVIRTVRAALLEYGIKDAP